MGKSAESCPICERKARWAAAAVGDFMEIECSECGHFQVSKTFLQLVPDQPAAVRQQSLERARVRARYGSLPLVTTYDLP